MARRLQQPTVASATSIATGQNGGSSTVTSEAGAQNGGQATVLGVGAAGPGETTVVDCRLNAGTDERLQKICVGQPSPAPGGGATSGPSAWDTANRCKNSPVGTTVVRDLQGKPWGFEDNASCAYR